MPNKEDGNEVDLQVDNGVALLVLACDVVLQLVVNAPFWFASGAP